MSTSCTESGSGVERRLPTWGVSASRTPSAISAIEPISLGSSRMRRTMPDRAVKRPGAISTPDRVAHDVFEYVRLVEHHDVVLGQDRSAACDVEPVEMGVDHDDVGGRGPAASLLGETRIAQRAAIGAGTLVAADADRTPCVVRRGPVEFGHVARRRRARPLGEPLDLDLGRDAPSSRAPAAPGRRRSSRAGVAGTRSSTVPSGPPSRSRVRGARRGRADPSWRVGPGAPWWRWRQPRRRRLRSPGRDRPASCPVPVPACTTRWRFDVDRRGDEVGHLLLADAFLGVGERTRDPGERFVHRASANAASSSCSSKSGQGASVK